jgi:hypothetical protein
VFLLNFVDKLQCRLLSSCLVRATSSTTDYCLKMNVGHIAWGEQELRLHLIVILRQNLSLQACFDCQEPMTPSALSVCHSELNILDIGKIIYYLWDFFQGRVMKTWREVWLDFICLSAVLWELEKPRNRWKAPGMMTSLAGIRRWIFSLDIVASPLL